MMSSALCRGLQTQPVSPSRPHDIWSPARRSYSGISTPVTSTPTKSYFMMGSRRSYSPPRRPQSAPGAREQRLTVPAAPEIETEEEYVEFYQKRILTAQQKQLLPLQEDLADWLNKLLESSDVTALNFMDALDDGLVVCRLAKTIQEQAQHAVDECRAKGPVPKLSGRIWQKAAKRSFFSRDNSENFIKFCRQLGVHENLIFESDDLVMHVAPRNVVICLLEVSRLASSKFGVEPSGLVQFEREIAECSSPFNNSRMSPAPGTALSDSGLSAASLMSWRPQSPTRPLQEEDDKNKLRLASSSSVLSLGSPGSSGRWSRPGSAGEEDEEPDTWRATLPLLEDAIEPDTSSRSGRTRNGSLSDLRSRTPCEERKTNKGLSELDRKVEQAAKAARKQCRCEGSDGADGDSKSPKCTNKLMVRRLGGGKYNIAGRNVFVRLLKGRHMMVRVGGGWDTLEHFLERHDPCQVRVLGRGDSSAANSRSNSRSSGINRIGLANNTPRNSSPATPSEGFLHIRAKYRSPPPARS
ncbi:uncharacterized protein LOC132201472 [Neocloeon triangulifer]|uniref:uncharacterized protein LOC132201472 n=1 Tax=Neocloeon triangulifer TaxID=2078957 RepID=UPI00286ECCF1|nr:uncharacterized protein LOC132201472 [Neocloeon triangulifer]